MPETVPNRLPLAAVSYLNTIPLVWGMVAGPMRDQVELRFELPSECAESVRARRVLAGLVPVIETARQNLAILADVGIACLGPVRSILLLSKVPPRRIRSLAADTSSRTSVMLTRVILKNRYGIEPALIPHHPDLPAMLAAADAALIIGDPALRLSPSHWPEYVFDLGQEWWNMTGLPMVFAAWAGPARLETGIFRASYEYGAARINEFVGQEAQRRGIPEALARDYLSRSIRYEIGAAERRGLEEYLQLAAIMEEIPA